MGTHGETKKMKNPFEHTIYENACLSKIDFNNEQSECISEFIENPKNLLFLHSAAGVGKTYFCAAVTNNRMGKGQYCWYVTEQELFEKLRSCISDGQSYMQKLQMMCENDFIILDDIGSTRGDSEKKELWLSPWQKEILFAFVDLRVKYALPTIVTSNYSLKDLSEIFHDRFISRLGATKNKCIKLMGDDKRMLGY